MMGIIAIPVWLAAVIATALVGALTAAVRVQISMDKKLALMSQTLENLQKHMEQHDLAAMNARIANYEARLNEVEKGHRRLRGGQSNIKLNLQVTMSKVGVDPVVPIQDDPEVM